MIDRYVDEVLPHKRPSTTYNQRYQLRLWKSQLGQESIANITPNMISEYRSRLSQSRSHATVNRYLAVLSHAFATAAQEWGWLKDNPFNKIKQAKEPRGRVRFLSDDGRKCLLESYELSRNPYLYMVVVLARSTGASKSEIVGLSWNDVDLRRQVITLHDTKNGERRVLPPAGHALDLMHQHAQNLRTDTNLVFPNRSG